MHPSRGEVVRVRRPSALPGVELVHVMGSRRPWSFFHDRFVLGVVAQGAEEWRHRGTTYTSAAGAVTMFAPGELVRHTRVQGPLEFRLLCLDAPALPGVAGLTAPHVEDPLLHRALLDLHAAADDGATAAELRARLDDVRQRMEAHTAPAAAEPAGAGHAAVSRALRHIHQHLARSFSLDELSRASYASKYHLVRVFHREVGLPPHAFQMHLRVARARALLAAGADTARAAFETGFADQAHLSRYFKRILGVTPGVYLRAALDRQPVMARRAPAA